MLANVKTCMAIRPEVVSVSRSGYRIIEHRNRLIEKTDCELQTEFGVRTYGEVRTCCEPMRTSQPALNSQCARSSQPVCNSQSAFYVVRLQHRRRKCQRKNASSA